VDPVCRPGTALAAAGVILVSVAIALRSVVRMSVDGVEAGTGSAWIGPRVRAWYRAALEPAEAWLEASGRSPDTLTYGQIAFSMLAGWAYARACVFLGGCLVLTAGTLDILDGGVARRRGVASRRGALIDSVADRWAEAATFLGLGILYRDGWMLAVVAVAAFGSQMVSYVRARAEALGTPMNTGRAQRPERYVLLGFGSVLAGIAGHLACGGGRPGHGILSACLVLLAGGSIWTAVERTRHAVAALGRSEAP
jgi:CDP-diacylglycerol--glycerol-3-phosphate 3-phosphatidyltransferase